MLGIQDSVQTIKLILIDCWTLEAELLCQRSLSSQWWHQCWCVSALCI